MWHEITLEVVSSSAGTFVIWRLLLQRNSVLDVVYSIAGFLRYGTILEHLSVLRKRLPGNVMGWEDSAFD